MRPLLLAHEVGDGGQPGAHQQPGVARSSPSRPGRVPEHGAPVGGGLGVHRVPEGLPGLVASGGGDARDGSRTTRASPVSARMATRPRAARAASGLSGRAAGRPGRAGPTGRPSCRRGRAVPGRVLPGSTGTRTGPARPASACRRPFGPGGEHVPGSPRRRSRSISPVAKNPSGRPPASRHAWSPASTSAASRSGSAACPSASSSSFGCPCATFSTPSASRRATSRSMPGSSPR